MWRKRRSTYNRAMKVYFGADHAGFELKGQLLAFVQDELHFDVEDCGAFEMDPGDDYPEIIANAAEALAKDLTGGMDSRAIVLGGSGQGEAIVANRFKGVRCALYYGNASKEQTDMSGKHLDVIRSSREHNNANALSLGARFISLDEAKDAVRTFLTTPFSADERHARRIEQIDQAA
jgi:ribose 5-phosphate isomerase B